MTDPVAVRSAPEAPISPVVLIRGAGEMASAVAWRLRMANIGRICMTELDAPLCVRRMVSFCVALESGRAQVEGVEARAAGDLAEVKATWNEGAIAVVGRSRWNGIAELVPDVVVDAILAKRNIATRMSDAALVIALGPGFVAGRDCHLVIETNRGHHLGRIIADGSAEANTGIPGDIAGHTQARVLRAGSAGAFASERRIGDRIAAGETVGTVAGVPVVAAVGGVLRGLLRSGTDVDVGVKLGDVDPRATPDYCHTISDKARAIAGAVLEAVMRHCNRPSHGRLVPEITET
jgi:xanthine dehydrogenase accessory factor